MSPILHKLILVASGLVVAGLLVATRRAWAPLIGHAIPSIWRIAKVTVAEARRRRVLQAVSVLAVLILVSMTFFSYLSPQEQARMLISGGLASINVFGILLAIFTAAFLIPHEIESRTIYPILAKPVRRFEFLLGKYIGSLIILGIIVAIMTGVLVAVLLIQDRLVEDLPGSAFNPSILPVVVAAAMSYCALAVLTALIILVSTFASTTMTVISAFMIWAVGSLQSTIHDLAEHAKGAAQLLLLVLYYVLPRLENFDFRHEVTNSVPIYMLSALEAVGVGIIYSAVALILAAIFFNDRQV